MAPRLKPSLSLPSFLTGAVVLIVVVFTFLELRPDLLFANTTTAGGDMGAHVSLPQYVRDHLLPHGRITGWSPDWYNGFPILQFYFPTPAVMVIILDWFLPYNIAFKLVTVSGLILLPVCAWAFGRMARLPFPAPACLAAATLPFLFDTGYTIFGGNIASTLAGEYSFSISLAFAFLFLGFVAGGLHTGKRRAWAAVLFALVVTSHVLPTIFAIVGGGILFIQRAISGRRKADESLTYSGMSDPYMIEVEGDENADADVVPAEAGIQTVEGEAEVIVEEEVIIDEPTQTEPAHGTGWKDRIAAFNWGAPVIIVGSLLSCAWLVPFVMRMQFMNDMGWEKIQPTKDAAGNLTASAVELYGQKIYTYTDALFPKELYPLLFLAGFGALWAIVSTVIGSVMEKYDLPGARMYSRRVGMFFVIMAVVWAIAFIAMPQGRLWNARFLPFWYLSLYMLAALFIAEIGWGLADQVRSFAKKSSSYSRDIAEGMSLVTPVVAIAICLIVVMAKLPAPDWWKLSGSLWHSSSSSAETSFIPGWTEWNYTGYERKEAYPEFSGLINAMGEVGQQYGCGRAFWEYESEENRFGTPMALMLLPTFTNGCIGSEEGLYFESTPSVAFHFLNQSELSNAPSRAMRGLPYPDLSVSQGVNKLQILGVKYYMALTPQTQAEANAEPRLTLVKTAPAAAGADGTARTWNIYEVAGTDLVRSVTNLPVVMTDQAGKEPVTTDSQPGGATKKRNARELWLDNTVAWYQNPNDYDTYVAASGPNNWPRIPNTDSEIPKVPVDPVNVTMIGTGDDRISFDVDRVGVPVIVKASYFPNWQVSGADGVYRVSPNQMVVVPTSKHVELHYGTTPVDWLGTLLTLGGLGGLAWLIIHDRRRKDEDDEEADNDFVNIFARPFSKYAHRKGETTDKPSSEEPAPLG